MQSKENWRESTDNWQRHKSKSAPPCNHEHEPWLLNLRCSDFLLLGDYQQWTWILLLPTYNPFHLLYSLFFFFNFRCIDLVRAMADAAKLSLIHFCICILLAHGFVPIQDESSSFFVLRHWFNKISDRRSASLVRILILLRISQSILSAWIVECSMLNVHLDIETRQATKC